MSKRMGASYEKTGVSQHRTEPGFRDKNFSGRLSMFESVWVIHGNSVGLICDVLSIPVDQGMMWKLANYGSLTKGM
jgi:hypothetical protein